LVITVLPLSDLRRCPLAQKMNMELARQCQAVVDFQPVLTVAAAAADGTNFRVMSTPVKW